MNNFTLVGRCKKITKINSNDYIIYIISTSPAHKEITIPIHVTKNDFIKRIKENDLLGISGTIDEKDSNNIFLATKVVWMPQK